MRISLMRFVTLMLAGACAVIWLILIRESVADAIPLAKGVRVARYTMLVFLLAVWPALILAICNVALRLALALAVLAAAVYGYMLFAFYPTPTGPVPLLVALLIAVVSGTYWMFAAADEPPRETSFAEARLRLTVLYVAGLGTALWLSSFEPIIRLANDPRADGFHAIPAFYGTIFYLAVVFPLLVIGIRGTERRSPNGVRALLVLTLAVSAIFGVPQLF